MYGDQFSTEGGNKPKVFKGCSVLLSVLLIIYFSMGLSECGKSCEPKACASLVLWVYAFIVLMILNIIEIFILFFATGPFFQKLGQVIMSVSGVLAIIILIAFIYYAMTLDDKCQPLLNYTIFYVWTIIIILIIGCVLGCCFSVSGIMTGQSQSN